MKKKTKALAIVLCAALLVGASVLTTLAYLTAKTDTVTNTFVTGKNVAITLDESKVDDEGHILTGKNAEKVLGNQYTLVPGHSYDKDPTVHVSASSADCWVFVKVENDLADLISGTSIEAQLTANGWTLVEGTSDVYAHSAKAQAGDDLVVFTGFTVSSNATMGELTQYEDSDATIQITAYAVQTDGFQSAAAAWSAAPCDFGFEADFEES